MFEIESEERVGYTLHIHHTGDAVMKFEDDTEVYVSECPSYYTIEYNDDKIVFEDDKDVTVQGTVSRGEYAQLHKESIEFLEGSLEVLARTLENRA